MQNERTPQQIPVYNWMYVDPARTRVKLHQTEHKNQDKNRENKTDNRYTDENYENITHNIEDSDKNKTITKPGEQNLNNQSKQEKMDTEMEQEGSQYVEYFIQCNGTVLKGKRASKKSTNTLDLKTNSVTGSAPSLTSHVNFASVAGSAASVGVYQSDSQISKAASSPRPLKSKSRDTIDTFESKRRKQDLDSENDRKKSRKKSRVSSFMALFKIKSKERRKKETVSHKHEASKPTFDVKSIPLPTQTVKIPDFSGSRSSLQGAPTTVTLTRSHTFTNATSSRGLKASSSEPANLEIKSKSGSTSSLQNVHQRTLGQNVNNETKEKSQAVAVESEGAIRTINEAYSSTDGLLRKSVKINDDVLGHLTKTQSMRDHLRKDRTSSSVIPKGPLRALPMKITQNGVHGNQNISNSTRQSIPVSRQFSPVLGQSSPVLGQSSPVLGQSWTLPRNSWGMRNQHFEEAIQFPYISNQRHEVPPTQVPRQQSQVPNQQSQLPQQPSQVPHQPSQVQHQPLQPPPVPPKPVYLKGSYFPLHGHLESPPQGSPNANARMSHSQSFDVGPPVTQSSRPNMTRSQSDHTAIQAQKDTSQADLDLSEIMSTFSSILDLNFNQSNSSSQTNQVTVTPEKLRVSNLKSTTSRETYQGARPKSKLKSSVSFNCDRDLKSPKTYSRRNKSGDFYRTNAEIYYGDVGYKSPKATETNGDPFSIVVDKRSSTCDNTNDMDTVVADFETNKTDSKDTVCIGSILDEKTVTSGQINFGIKYELNKPDHKRKPEIAHQPKCVPNGIHFIDSFIDTTEIFKFGTTKHEPPVDQSSVVTLDEILAELDPQGELYSTNESTQLRNNDQTMQQPQSMAKTMECLEKQIDCSDEMEHSARTISAGGTQKQMGLCATKISDNTCRVSAQEHEQIKPTQSDKKSDENNKKNNVAEEELTISVQKDMCVHSNAGLLCSTTSDVHYKETVFKSVEKSVQSKDHCSSTPELSSPPIKQTMNDAKSHVTTSEQNINNCNSCIDSTNISRQYETIRNGYVNTRYSEPTLLYGLNNSTRPKVTFEKSASYFSSPQQQNCIENIQGRITCITLDDNPTILAQNCNINCNAKRDNYVSHSNDVSGSSNAHVRKMNESRDPCSKDVNKGNVQEQQIALITDSNLCRNHCKLNVISVNFSEEELCLSPESNTVNNDVSNEFSRYYRTSCSCGQNSARSYVNHSTKCLSRRAEDKTTCLCQERAHVFDNSRPRYCLLRDRYYSCEKTILADKTEQRVALDTKMETKTSFSPDIRGTKPDVRCSVYDNTSQDIHNTQQAKHLYLAVESDISKLDNGSKRCQLKYNQLDNPSEKTKQYQIAMGPLNCESELNAMLNELGIIDRAEGEIQHVHDEVSTKSDGQNVTFPVIATHMEDTVCDKSQKDIDRIPQKLDTLPSTQSEKMTPTSSKSRGVKVFIEKEQNDNFNGNLRYVSVHGEVCNVVPFDSESVQEHGKDASGLGEGYKECHISLDKANLNRDLKETDRKLITIDNLIEISKTVEGSDKAPGLTTAKICNNKAVHDDRQVNQSDNRGRDLSSSFHLYELIEFSQSGDSVGKINSDIDHCPERSIETGTYSVKTCSGTISTEIIPQSSQINPSAINSDEMSSHNNELRKNLVNATAVSKNSQQPTNEISINGANVEAVDRTRFTPHSVPAGDTNQETNQAKNNATESKNELSVTKEDNGAKSRELIDNKKKHSRSSSLLCCVSKSSYKSDSPVVEPHRFQLRPIKEPMTCVHCNHVVWNQASYCTACKIVCHRKCEGQVSPHACQ